VQIALHTVNQASACPGREGGTQLASERFWYSYVTGGLLEQGHISTSHTTTQ